MAVEAVDARDEEAFAAWFAVLDASAGHERPGEPHWSLQEQRELALSGLPGDPDAAVEQHLLLDRDAGGAARLTLHRRDNLAVADVLVLVHPERRRRGTGSRLLEAARHRARAAGRTALSAEVDEPGEGAPGRAFLEHHGFACGLVEVRRDLALPPDPERLAHLEAEARSRGAGYEVRTWRDRTPDELVEDRALVERRMSTDAPVGDQPYEEEAWDASRVRANEDKARRQGRTWFAAGALRDGRLVAHTEVGVPLAAPERAYQWGTLVLREHRGHRLGLLVKLAALRALVDGSPATRSVSTWNAATNAPMAAVNEALGFVVNGRLSSWHRALDA